MSLLIDRHDAGRERANARERELIEKVSARLPPASSADLQRFVSAHQERGDVAAWNLYFFLELLNEKGPMLPVATLSYDFVAGSLQLRVALFSVREREGGPVLRAVGYRFESPEAGRYEGGGDGELLGAHDYFHAQPIMRLVKDAPRSALADSEARWVPEAQPAFPLEASDVLELLVCTLVTIYGKSHVASPDFAEVRKPLAKEAGRLDCVRALSGDS